MPSDEQIPNITVKLLYKNVFGENITFFKKKSLPVENKAMYLYTQMYVCSIQSMFFYHEDAIRK